MANIIHRENYLISLNIQDNARFVITVNLGFKPDTMIVKLINCADISEEEGTPNTFLIYCSDIKQYIGSFTSSTCNITPNLIFDHKGATINTDWTFEIHNISKQMANPAEVKVALALHLEFLKHL